MHLRVDNEEKNSERKFACGIGPELPLGDQYMFGDELSAPYRIDCPGCNPSGPKKYGTLLSELSGRPGQPGYEEFCYIAKSWGYD